MRQTLRSKEFARGKILYYLVLVYPQSAALAQVQSELDFFGLPLPVEDLSFHVAYLVEKGLVAVEAAPGASAPARRRVRVTSRGIDYYDRRLPPDPGIYLAPHH